MANDAFLEIIGESDGLKILGETNDTVFSKKNAVEVTHFRFGSVSLQKDSRELEYNRKNVGAIVMRVMSEMRPNAGKSTSKNKPLKDEDDAFKEKMIDALSSYVTKEMAEYALERHEEGERLQEEGVEKPTFTIDKELDYTSPSFLLAYSRTVSGLIFAPFPSAKLSLRKRGGKTTLVYLVLEFTNLVVVGYEVESDEEKSFKETVTFRFDTCKATYKPQNIQGGWDPALTAGFDFANNTDLSE